MIDLVNKAVEKLSALGVEAGDRVAIACEGRCEEAITVVALWKMAAVAVPIIPKLPKELEEETLGRVGVKLVLRQEQLKQIAGYSKAILKFCRFEDLALDINAEASVIFTSASTLLPKAVVHTIGNHYYSALGSAENIPFDGDDCWDMCLPMFHVSGFSLIMRALVGGASIYFIEMDDDFLEEEMVTHVSMVPTMLIRLFQKGCREELRDIKSILLGGGPIPVWLIEKSRQLGLPVHTTYGSTELCSQIATDGRVLRYRDVKIADDGEILVKGKTLFKGYLTGDGLVLPLDKDGFFATGDLGRFDEGGHLQIIGRKDFMFISGGENIYPEQIERALTLIDNIAQAVVVPVDDAEFGQRPVAFLQTIDGKEFDVEEIRTQLRRMIESFKIPITFYTMSEIQARRPKPNRIAMKECARGLYKGERI